MTLASTSHFTKIKDPICKHLNHRYTGGNWLNGWKLEIFWVSNNYQTPCGYKSGCKMSDDVTDVQSNHHNISFANIWLNNLLWRSFWALRRMTAESAIFCTKIMTFRYKLYCIRFGNVPQLETSDFNQSWSQPGTSTFLAKRVWVLDNHEVNLCEASLSPLTQTSHPLIKKWSCEMHCWQRWQMIIANLRRHFKLPRDQQWPLDTLANRANLTTFHMLWCTMCLTTALCDSVCSSAVFSFVLSGDLLRAFPVLKTWGLGVKHHLWSFGVL